MFSLAFTLMILALLCVVAGFFARVFFAIGFVVLMIAIFSYFFQGL